MGSTTEVNSRMGLIHQAHVADTPNPDSILLHRTDPAGESYSLIDVNRSGVPVSILAVNPLDPPFLLRRIFDLGGH
jgi:hypothetical protein